jgi:hypothetical protein
MRSGLSTLAVVRREAIYGRGIGCMGFTKFYNWEMNRFDVKKNNNGTQMISHLRAVVKKCENDIEPAVP